MRSLCLLLAFPPMVLAPCAGEAATWHVPGDAGTIQQALTMAWLGDEVLVASGAYFESDLVLKTGVILRSEGGVASSVTIDAQGQGRVFYVGPGVLVPVVEGFTVTGGVADFGGGAYVGEDASVLFTECVFEGNSALWAGGGIFCANTHGSYVRLYSSVLFGNSAGEEGGALYCGRSTVDLTQCTLSHNSAGVLGGGVCAEAESDLCMENSIIAFSTHGGAVYSDGTCSLTLSCCDVYGNAGGDWVGCISGMGQFEGNQWADPLFCDAPAGDVALQTASPCAPENSPTGCGLVGACGVGCNCSSVSGNEAEASALFFLWPAIPNPAGPVTNIAYRIPAGEAPSKVVVRVFDATGREVAALVNAEQPPGTYTAIWDGTDHGGARVASGTYFCQITWGGRSQTTRIVLLR